MRDPELDCQNVQINSGECIRNMYIVTLYLYLSKLNHIYIHNLYNDAIIIIFIIWSLYRC